MGLCACLPDDRPRSSRIEGGARPRAPRARRADRSRPGVERARRDHQVEPGRGPPLRPSRATRRQRQCRRPRHTAGRHRDLRCADRRREVEGRCDDHQRRVQDGGARDDGRPLDAGTAPPRRCVGDVHGRHGAREAGRRSERIIDRRVLRGRDRLRIARRNGAIAQRCGGFDVRILTRRRDRAAPQCVPTTFAVGTTATRPCTGARWRRRRRCGRARRRSRRVRVPDVDHRLTVERCRRWRRRDVDDGARSVGADRHSTRGRRPPSPRTRLAFAVVASAPR